MNNYHHEQQRYKFKIVCIFKLTGQTYGKISRLLYRIQILILRLDPDLSLEAKEQKSFKFNFILNNDLQKIPQPFQLLVDFLELASFRAKKTTEKNAVTAKKLENCSSSQTKAKYQELNVANKIMGPQSALFDFDTSFTSEYAFNRKSYELRNSLGFQTKSI